MKRCAFQTIRPVVSRKKHGFSVLFGPGDVVPPSRVLPSQVLTIRQKRRKEYKHRAWWRTMSDAFHGAGDCSPEETPIAKSTLARHRRFNGAGDRSPDMMPAQTPSGLLLPGFNGAGDRSPDVTAGKSLTAAHAASFNEAGDRSPDVTIPARFNAQTGEASMGPGISPRM